MDGEHFDLKDGQVNPLMPDIDMAVEFLRGLSPDGPWTLVALLPDRDQHGRAELLSEFHPDDEARCRAWIRDRQREGRNIHYTSNEPALPFKRHGKAEVRQLRAMHLDADLPGPASDPVAIANQLRQVAAYEPPPTAIVFSGGGHQAIWKLREPLPAHENTERIERGNEAIARRIGADTSTRDVSRLLRLPGTVNYPNETKRQRGREPVLSRLVAADWDRLWSHKDDAMPRLPAEQEQKAGKKGDQTRSGAVFRIARRLHKTGGTFEAFCAAVRDDPDTASWYETKGLANDQRELKRAWENSALPSGPPWKISLAAPYDTARLFLRVRYTSEEQQQTLYRYRDGFYAWNGSAYPEADDAEVRAKLYDFLDNCTAPVKKEWVSVHPDTRCVNNVADALRAAAILPSAIEAPAWLEPSDLDPNEITSCANGLLHLPTNRLLPHTPAYFTHNALDYAYDPLAPEPKQWLRFLHELWEGDQESIDTLQEICGLCLTPDTSHQKAFLLIGPKRSGKGTIARILIRLIGAANCVAPTLSGIGKSFGLQPLIGKRLAIISDARLRAGRADQCVIAERLLSITGEDAITADRKYRESWTGLLRTRFLVLTNELPRLDDASGALANRFIILLLTKSFFGHEDHTLTEKLLQELPGILNWAIEGWRRLQERRYFVQPKSAIELVGELEDLGSPTTAFLRDRCVTGSGCSVKTDDLFFAWEGWCTEQRRQYSGDKQAFGRDLRAALPGLKISQRSDGKGGKERIYEGIRLKAEGEDEGREPALGEVEPQGAGDGNPFA